MPVKDDWVDGDSFGAGDANTVADAVNANTTDIAGKQDSDSDLTAIAGLSPTNDDVLQRKSGAWTNRTPTQLKTDLAVTKSDVGLSNVTNNAQYFPGGTDVAVADGGTGVSTLTGIVKGNGASAFTAAAAGTDYVAPGGALGTPSSGNASNLTSFPTLNQNTTGSAAKLTTPRNINGVAFDGTANITVPGPYSSASTTSTATPSINADTTDFYSITALAAAITSVTVTGTPTDGQKLMVRIKDNGSARAITWGASFEDGTVALPTTTVAGKTLLAGFIYDAVDTAWACEATGSRA